LYSAVLGLVYVITVLFTQYSDFFAIVGALLRFESFVAVALTIVYPSVTLEKKQFAPRSVSEFNEEILSNGFYQVFRR